MYDYIIKINWTKDWSNGGGVRDWEEPQRWGTHARWHPAATGDTGKVTTLHSSAKSVVSSERKKEIYSWKTALYLTISKAMTKERSNLRRRTTPNSDNWGAAVTGRWEEKVTSLLMVPIYFVTADWERPHFFIFFLMDQVVVGDL